MKLYAVGGAVRDHLRGSVGKDLDFAVEAESFEAMRQGLRDRGFEMWLSRPEYVTVRGRMPLDSLGKFSGIVGPPDLYKQREGSRQYFVEADFTLCRKEAMYADGRHPSVVTPADILTDLSRRDFTMNAIAVTEDGEYIDPFGGKTDIQDKTITTVGRPRDRFEEDPLRMLRAIRFAVTMRFWIDMATSQAMDDPDIVAGLAVLPVERVTEELQRALRKDWRETMLHLLVSQPRVGQFISAHYPELWLKATTENR